MVSQKEHIEIEKIKAILSRIMDPEVPVLSILDLGIVRKINVEGSKPVITVTPTYTGCPAYDLICSTIRMELAVEGYPSIEIIQELAPAWTTDWMTESGKQKLKEYGIAPPNPVQQTCHAVLFQPNEAVECPHCGSYHTKRISEFGSTACKSLFQCVDCQEPFDYFKSL